MLTILAGVATWEREIMLERQREGIAKAKAAGKYKGRPISIDAAQIRQLRAELGPTAIAKKLGIARSSVYRVLGTWQAFPLMMPIRANPNQISTNPSWRKSIRPPTLRSHRSSPTESFRRQQQPAT